MDYIKKTICLEGVRTRTQGLMPYYEFGTGNSGRVSADGPNGNWGQFVANPVFLGTGKTYETMLHNYYSILNMVRNGVKLRKVETKNEEIIFTEDVGSFYINGECFSGGTEPDNLYAYAAYDAKDFYSQEIDSLREETRRIYRTNQDVSQVYVVLIEDYEKFDDLSKYLKGTTYNTTLARLNPKNIYSGDTHFEWERYCEVVDLCIGKLNVPANIYNEHIKVPKSMPCADVEPYIEWLEGYSARSEDCCNERLWNDMGGEEMLEFLYKNSGICQQIHNVLDGLQYRVPYIEMPLLLVQNFTDVGVLTNVDGAEYEVNDENRPHNSNSPTGFTIDRIMMGGSSSTAMPRVESLLYTLRSKKKYIDDEDNLLPGLFKEYANDRYVECRKSGGSWLISGCSGDSLINGDGMTSEEIAGTNYYRSVTTESSAKRIAEVYEEENSAVTTFYFKVKYDNSQSSPMTLPYSAGNTTNVYVEDESNLTYRGDFILPGYPKISDNEVEIKYVIGGRFRGTSDGKFVGYIDGGDVYYEKHRYDSAHLVYVALDGVGNVPIYSEYIDFEGDIEEFYSPVYNLYRTGTTASIIDFKTGEVWNKDFAYDAYLTKEDYLINFSMPPKVDVNVTIDRGGVSAFEKHYKLSECNTMQDLEQYGNHYFFPE